MSALAGKPKGHDRKQKERWTENDKEIVFALMQAFPRPLRIVDIHRQTGIKKHETIQKHMKPLQKAMAIEEAHRGAWKIHPSFFHSLTAQEAFERGLLTPERLQRIETKRFFDELARKGEMSKFLKWYIKWIRKRALSNK